MKKIAKLIMATMMIATSCTLSAEVLPAPQTAGGMPLMQAMQERKSMRDIDPASTVTKQDLSNMLWAAWGITHEGKRTIATAMNRQELILYVITPTEISRYTAGAASHAIYLYCASVGLKTTVRAMLDNDEVERAMKLGDDERLLYIQTVGR